MFTFKNNWYQTNVGMLGNITTRGSSVMCLKTRDISQIEPCTHEEAESRMMLHVKDAVAEEHKSVMIRTVNTDVVVIAINISFF